MEAPLIATQLLWINLITDSFPAIALSMDPGNPDVMKEKPRDSKESFFAGGAGLHLILGGVLIGTLQFWLSGSVVTNMDTAQNIYWARIKKENV